MPAVRVHYSMWLGIFIISSGLAVSFYPRLYPRWEEATNWTVGIVSALAVYGMVLLHELGHSVMAQHLGLKVHSINLWVFGGAAQLDDSRTASEEFVIAVIGPLVSLALGILCYWALSILHRTMEIPVAVLAYLTVINVLLGAFNLIPMFPLDGGRILRALTWEMTGSEIKATKISSLVGMVLSGGLVALGGFQLGRGNVVGGVWMVLVGLFIFSSAWSTLKAAEARVEVAQFHEILKEDEEAIRRILETRRIRDN